MVLLLDRSNSMRDLTPSGTKWTDLTASINSVLARRSEVAWGLSLFPASDRQACQVSSISVTIIFLISRSFFLPCMARLAFWKISSNSF